MPTVVGRFPHMGDAHESPRGRRARSFPWVGPALAVGVALMMGCLDINAPFSSSAGEEDATWAAVVAQMPGGTLKQASSAPALESNTQVFPLVQGSGGMIKVYYTDPDPNDEVEPDWLLKIQVPESTQLVDPSGRMLEEGDTLLVSVTPDPTSFMAHFEPHGTRFMGKHPVKLAFSFRHGDLGDQDPGKLAIWYRATEADKWTRMLTEVDKRGSMILMDLEHFSNYAVAF